MIITVNHIQSRAAATMVVAKCGTTKASVVSYSKDIENLAVQTLLGFSKDTKLTRNATKRGKTQSRKTK